MTTQTGTMATRNFEVPDQTNSIGDMARVEVIGVGDLTAIRATMNPGFHWTEHARPVIGTDLCQGHHIGYVVSGRSRVQLADGTERELAAGDVFDIPPGHDMWVIGNEPYVAVEIERANAD